jgi:hypothetical protein
MYKYVMVLLVSAFGFIGCDNNNPPPPQPDANVIQTAPTVSATVVNDAGRLDQ